MQYCCLHLYGASVFVTFIIYNSEIMGTSINKHIFNSFLSIGCIFFALRLANDGKLIKNKLPYTKIENYLIISRKGASILSFKRHVISLSVTNMMLNLISNLTNINLLLRLTELLSKHVI